MRIIFPILVLGILMALMFTNGIEVSYAYKSVGTENTKIGYKFVCGDFISQNPCTVKEKIERFLDSKISDEGVIYPGSRFMVGGISLQSLNNGNPTLLQQGIGTSPVTIKETVVFDNFPNNIPTTKPAISKFTTLKMNSQSIVPPSIIPSIEKNELLSIKYLEKPSIPKIDSSKILELKNQSNDSFNALSKSNQGTPVKGNIDEILKNFNPIPQKTGS